MGDCLPRTHIYTIDPISFAVSTVKIVTRFITELTRLHDSATYFRRAGEIVESLFLIITSSNYQTSK